MIGEGEVPVDGQADLPTIIMPVTVMLSCTWCGSRLRGHGFACGCVQARERATIRYTRPPDGPDPRDPRVGRMLIRRTAL